MVCRTTNNNPYFFWIPILGLTNFRSFVGHINDEVRHDSLSLREVQGRQKSDFCLWPCGCRFNRNWIQYSDININYLVPIRRTEGCVVSQSNLTWVMGHIWKELSKVQSWKSLILGSCWFVIHAYFNCQLVAIVTSEISFHIAGRLACSKFDSSGFSTYAGKHRASSWSDVLASYR